MTLQSLRSGPFQVFRQANGASVCVNENSYGSLASLSLRVAGGSSDDPIGKSGLAHLFEHLLFTGTPRTGRDGFNPLVEQLGGDGGASTAVGWTKFYQLFTPEIALDILALETDRFAGTIGFLTDEILEREKTVIKNERLQRVDSTPYGDAIEHLFQLLYGDSPIGRIPVGRADEIASITLADCHAYFATGYSGSRISAALSGRITVDAVIEGLVDLLGTFPAGERNSPVRSVVAPPVGGLREVRSDLPPKIFSGYVLPPAESPDYDSVRLASYLLGKGGRARLAQMLVDDDAILSDVKVKTLTRVGTGSVGIIEAVPAEGVEVARARDALHAALSDLIRSGVSAEDAQRAAADYRRSWYRDDDSTRGRAEGLSLALLRAGDPDRYLRELDPAMHDGRELIESVLAYWGPDRIVGEVTYL